MHFDKPTRGFLYTLKLEYIHCTALGFHAVLSVTFPLNLRLVTSTLFIWPVIKCGPQGQQAWGSRKSTGHLVVFQWLCGIGKSFIPKNIGLLILKKK